MKIVTILIASLIILNAPVFADQELDAGYEWAKQHDIRDTGYNMGRSASFNAGVQEYAAEQKSEATGFEQQYERVPNTVEETRMVPSTANEKVLGVTGNIYQDKNGESRQEEVDRMQLDRDWNSDYRPNINK